MKNLFRFITLTGMLIGLNEITLAQLNEVSTFPTITSNNGQSGIAFEITANQNIELTGVSNAFNAGTQTAIIWIRPGG